MAIKELCTILLMFCIFGIFLGIYFAIDKIITNKRLNENQREWEKYSEGMTDTEKRECFSDWLTMRKLEKGWSFYYIPKI